MSVLFILMVVVIMLFLWLSLSKLYKFIGRQYDKKVQEFKTNLKEEKENENV